MDQGLKIKQMLVDAALKGLLKNTAF